jgi:uncharacterized protein (TIGR02680 family)
VNDLPLDPSAPPASPAADPVALPAPTRADRWQPVRSGVLNLYRFDYEEFHFEGGRLLLRGNNGAGKSRLLALQLPFLLDGETTPARVEPDGDVAKRIEWNLLMGRHADRTGYTWIEFGRRNPDGAAEYVTLGCGLRAVAGQSGLRARWFFITPQRVGRDLFLQNASGQPLGRERLEEALTPAGRIFTGAHDYRAAVDAALFGLGDRYPRLLDLLIRLRRPQLSRKLDEEELSQTLSDALPVLPVALVEIVAEAFRGLQADREAWQGFRAAREGVDGFLREYRLYARTALRRRAGAVRSAHSAVEDAQRRLRDAERRTAEAEASLQRLADEQSARDRDLAATEEAERTLRSSPEMRTADELDQAARTAATTRGALDRAKADEAAAMERSELARQRLAEAERAVAAIAEQADSALRTTELLAHEAGLLPTHRSHLAGPPVTAWSDLQNTPGAADRLNREVHRRRQSIALLRQRETETAAAKQTLERHEGRRREADAACSATRETETASRRALDEAGLTLQRTYRDWHTHLHELRCPTADELAEDFAAWLSRREGESPLHTAATTAHHDAVARLAADSERLRQQLADEEAALAKLRAELSSLEQGGTPPPPVPLTRRAVRTGRPGAPLWRLCDFAPGVEEAARAGLEASLEAAGLLDAWLLPDGRLLAPDTEDTFLLSGATGVGTHAAHLGTVLVPAIDAADSDAAALTEETVARVLRTIGFGPDQGPHWVAADGAWRLGPIHGRWTKPAAEFIGETTRTQARRRRIAALHEQIAQVEIRHTALTTARAVLAERRTQADGEFSTLPSADPVRHADFALSVAVRAAAEAFAAHEKAERETAQARRALDEACRRRDTDAADCGLSTWLGRLDALEPAVADYAAALAGLWPTLRHWESETRQSLHSRQAAVTATEEHTHRLARRQEASEAAAAAEQRHRVLQETHGATIEAIMQRLRDTESALATLRAAARDGQQEQLRQTSARDTAAGDRGHADEERGRHEELRTAAIDHLQRFAEPRLFAEADPALATIEPAGWSVTRAVEIARLIEPMLADTPAGDEVWSQRQDTIHGHIQELRDRLVSQGHQPETHQLEDFVLVRCLFQARPHTMTELRDAFAAEVAERERLLAAREKEIIENHLLGEVAVELQKLIRAAEEWIATANSELAARPTSTGLRFRFAWETVDEGGFPAIRRAFLRTSELWAPAERTALAQFLQSRIRAAQADDEDGSWRDHLGSALDYRRWHRFAVERQQDGQWRRLDRRTYGTGSGGEKALALTLPRFAAAAAYYRSAAAHAPRLVMLDEAFAGIDPTMRAQCLGVLEQFDLDVVMTSELEWGCYPTVPALGIYHLAAFPGVDAIGVTRWVWNGRECRQLDTPLPPDRPPAASTESANSTLPADTPITPPPSPADD